MAQVSITEESHKRLTIYANYHNLKLYEALGQLIDDGCSSLKIVDTSKTNTNTNTNKEE